MADDGVHKNVGAGQRLAPEDVAATDDVSVGDDLTVTGAAAVGETLGVTGIATLTGGVKVGTSEAGLVKGIYFATVSVTVPSITDPDCAKVDVDVAAAFTIAPAVGDLVLVAPQVALPTNCRLGAAQVTATDTVQITFHSEGGNVTGAAKNCTIAIIKLV